jgi:DNA-binding transcriptional regulator YiaG
MVIDGGIPIAQTPRVEKMTAAEFRQALTDLNMSQAGFARATGVSGRMVRYWISGEYPIPRRTKAIIDVMIELNDAKITQENFS